MKTKLLFYLSTLLFTFSGVSQTLIVAAPANNGATTGLRAPNGTAAQTTLRAHFIIPASELAAIPSGTVITDLGVNMSSGAVGNATGNLHFYLENTTDAVNNKSVDWSIATAPMSTVYNGPFVIPTAAGPADFTLTNSFTYTGGGIYVAYEYIGTTFATTGAVYLASTVLPSSCRTGATGTSTPLDSLDGLSDWRPEIRFIFTNPYTNNIGVDNIEADFGSVNLLLQDDSEVEVVISNLASVAATNVPVTLNVSGASTYTATQTIGSLGANSNTTLTFSNIPAASAGDNIIQITVPSDQQTSNDTLVYVQRVTCDSLGYSNSGPSTGSVGFNTGTGILAAKYDLPNTVPVNINSVDLVIGNNAASVGNTIKGVLLNSTGVLVDSTLPYTIAAGDLGQGVTLSFLGGSTDYSGQSIFAGIRQPANTTTGYYPVAMQSKVNPPTNTYASFGVNGGTPTYQNTLDPFMILITVEPRPLVVFSNTTGQICSGSSATIDVFPAVFDDYDLFDGTTLLQSNTTGSFTVNPSSTTTYTVVPGSSSCAGIPGNVTISVVSQFNTTLNEEICSGDSFNFNGQIITSTGQYVDTMQANGGCDSIITLNLNVLQSSTATLTESICEGDTYLFNGQAVSATGVYTDVIPNTVGCDSTVTLNLTVLLDDVAVTQSGATLTANTASPNPTYQWVDCDNNNAPIAGATSQNFTPTADIGVTGNYAVEITSGNCTKISPCTFIDFTGLKVLDGSDITIYPNPTQSIVNIRTNLTEKMWYTVYDIHGKIVLTETALSNENKLINVERIEAGSYLLVIRTESGIYQAVFVKQ